MHRRQLRGLALSGFLVAACGSPAAQRVADEPDLPDLSRPTPTDPLAPVPIHDRDAAPTPPLGAGAVTADPPAVAPDPTADAGAAAPASDARRDGASPAPVPLPDIKPLMSIPSKLLLDETFSSPTWKKSWSLYAGDFQVVDGALRAAPIPGKNHPAEASFTSRIHDVIVQFRFRLDGASYLGLQMSDNRVPQHVAAALASPGSIALSRVTGWGGTTKYTTLDRRTMPTDRTRWFGALLEMRGNEFLLQVDGQCLLYGQTEGLDVDKTRISFISSGSVALYDDVKLWTATPDPRWESRRDEVLRARGKCQ